MLAFLRLGHLQRLAAVAALPVLTGCIDSTAPILTGAEPLIGQRPQLQFYGIYDGLAHEPTSGRYRWADARYVRIGGTFTDLDAFTLHGFENGDLIVQSTRTGKPVEYAIARKIAEGTYLIFPIDENDADAGTRAKFCDKNAPDACRVSTPEALRAFARASAAKPHSSGGLALVMANP